MMPAPVLGPIGDLGAHAQVYAEASLPVFPADPKSKAPLTEHGLYDATTDPDQISIWWGKWPEALIAHRIAPDQLLLDVDPRHGGLDTWLALKAELGGQLPVTRVHQSGRGDQGTHFWWLRPDEKLSTKKLDAWARERELGHDLGARWTAGIDLLHHTLRYTILPPSPHPDTGKPYRWVDRRGLDIAPAPMPALLADLIVADDPAPAVWIPPAEPDTDSIADWYTRTHTFADVLGPHGWRIVGGDGYTDGSRWKHPGATSACSATVRHGCLFVYSTSTPFEPTVDSEPHGYTPFRAFAVLEHGGDLQAAARAARAIKDPTPQDLTAWIPSAAPTPVVVAAEETPVTVRDPDIHQLLNEPHDEYDWLIEGLLERGDRTILTGPEGGGKTTLLRQIAVMAAAGTHPFTEDVINPVRVLYVDLENSRRQTARQFAPLVFTAGTLLAEDMLIPILRPEGLDLLTRADCQWLAERIEANQPDLLIIGPLYKLALGDPISEEVARHVAFALDALREHYRVAVLIEAHQPHKNNGHRPDRPYGASLWMRWPEFGLALTQSGFLNHWRGPRDERAWPLVLKRGGTWPWVPGTSSYANFATLMDACQEAGEMLSERELARRTGIPKTSVHRAIEANRTQWDSLADTIGEDTQP